MRHTEHGCSDRGASYASITLTCNNNDSQHVEHRHGRLQDYRECSKVQVWDASGWIVVIGLLVWLFILHYQNRVGHSAPLCLIRRFPLHSLKSCQLTPTYNRDSPAHQSKSSSSTRFLKLPNPASNLTGIPVAEFLQLHLKFCGFLTSRNCGEPNQLRSLPAVDFVVPSAMFHQSLTYLTCLTWIKTGIVQLKD